MSTLNNVSVFPEDRHLKGIENWVAFKDFLFSLAHSKGLLGYLEGTIPEPSPPAAGIATVVAVPTFINSSAPSHDEWLFREGHVSGLIYQNIVDPGSHRLSPDMSAANMWSGLKVKFEVSMQVYQDIALKQLESVHLAERGDFEAHLHTLETLCITARNIGCTVSDAKMISVIFSSLPPTWFTLVQAHQSKSKLEDVVAALMEYWMFVNRDKAITVADLSALAALLSGTSTPNNSPIKFVCSNCNHTGHTDMWCWAAGGGMEGKGPKWYKAPKGKEPITSESTVTNSSAAIPTAAAVIDLTPIETFALGANMDEGRCLLSSPCSQTHWSGFSPRL